MALQLLMSGICALTSLPGPPSMEFENGSYQLYPIDRRICPEIDPQRDTRFELYTRNNTDEPQMLLTDEIDSVKSSNINFTNPTKIFFHGYLGSSDSYFAQQMKTSYLERGVYNVILVNNKRLLAGPYYGTAASNCKPIGQYSARFIDFLVSQGLKLSKLHLIGISLGGHIAGFTGKYVTSGKIARITGLDPAGPLFVDKDQSERIGPDDAILVDIIHTNAGEFGISIKCGKIDIWVNGGSIQPGCSPIEILETNVFCSHVRSIILFIKSIECKTCLSITKCSSYPKYQEEECCVEGKTYLGEDINQSCCGDFCINTNGTAMDL